MLAADGVVQVASHLQPQVKFARGSLPNAVFLAFLWRFAENT
jgi:hypothetical protein